MALRFGNKLVLIKRFARQVCSKYSTGLFGIDALSSPAGFLTLEKNVYEQCSKLIDETANSGRSRKMVEIFDDLSNSICKVADLAECMRNLHPDPKFACAAEECMARLSLYVEQLNTDVELYKRLKNCILTEGNETDRRVASLFASDFEASGVHLPSKQREQFVELSQEIFRAGSSFSRGCELPSKILRRKREEQQQKEEEQLQSKKSSQQQQLNSILGSKLKQRQSSFLSPNDHNHNHNDIDELKSSSSSSQQSVVVDDGGNDDEVVYHHHHVTSCSADSPDPNLRRSGYKFFYQPSNEQETHLKRLLQCRHELASLSGFPTFAHRSLRDCILEKPEDVEAFLIDLIGVLKPKAEQELEILQKYLPPNRPVSVWDLPYVKSIYRQERLCSMTSKLRGRFDIDSVLKGVERLVFDLYGIKLEKAAIEPGETWHPDVEKIIALDENGNICGTIYCDWFDRSFKNATDSHFTVRCGKMLSSPSSSNGSCLHHTSYQTPIVVLAFRYPKERYQSKNGANSLNVIEFTNILHEFGHAMHSILGRTKYQHVSGTRCPTDFAEIPSNLMEFYLSDHRTLLSFSNNNWMNKRSEQDASLQKNEIIDLIDASNSFSASETLQQTVYALFDLRLHSSSSPTSTAAATSSSSTVEIFDQLCSETWPFLKVPGTAWHHRFSHLVPYGSKYHAYLVAKAAASLIWKRLFKEKPYDKVSGEKWRQIQAYGGELPPNELLTKLLNKRLVSRDFSEALL